MATRKEILENLIAEMEAMRSGEQTVGDVGEAVDVLEDYVDAEIQLMVEEMARLKERIVAFNNIKKEFDTDPFAAAGDLEELTRTEKNMALKMALTKVFKFFS